MLWHDSRKLNFTSILNQPCLLPVCLPYSYHFKSNQILWYQSGLFASDNYTVSFLIKTIQGQAA